MITRSGEIKFEASMPAFEEVAAKNNTVSCIFDKSTGDIAVLALVKAFRFKVPLMEEHFNENYIESDKFPKATFKGKVTNFDAAKVASGKATAAGARDGFVKVIYDAKYGELLGAHMIGYNVTELIAEAVVVRKLESTAYEIMKTVHPHPTMSEAFKGATEAAYGEAVDL